MSQYYTMLTTVGLAKLQNAAATGTKVDITTVAVGDGNGNPVTPSQDMTALVHQVWSGPVTRYEVDTNNPTQIIIEGYIPADVGGWTIRELGIFDTDGDMIAVGNYDATPKPAISSGLVRDLLLRTIIELGNYAGAVEIRIDPAVVLASRQWVNDELAAHNDDPDAHPDKADVNGNPGEVFRVADAVNEDDAINLRQLDQKFAAAISWKNRIINGDFTIRQRSVSSLQDAGGFLCDRWYGEVQGGEIAVTIDAGFARIDITQDNGITLMIPYRYRFEGQHISDLTTVSLSFNFAASRNGDYSYYLHNPVTDLSIVGIFRYGAAGDQQRIAIEGIDLSALGAVNNNESFALELVIAGQGAPYQDAAAVTLGAGDWCAIAMVQFENGPSATNFEQVPRDVQLLRSMRYYEIVPALNTVSIEGQNNGRQTIPPIKFSVVKRAAPTIPVLRIWYDKSNTARDFPGIATPTLVNLYIDSGGDTSSYDGVMIESFPADAEL